MVNKKYMSNGFSLVEMAVVIVLIGVLMTFGIKLATSFQDRSTFTATHNKQILLKEALVSYLAQNGRLPCPASILAPPTGVETPSVPPGTCTENLGFIPYVTLGIPKDAAVDGWGRMFLYEVSNSAIPACDSSWVTESKFLGATRTYHEGELGCITIIEDENGDGAITADISRLNRVAVIISNGANGEGGYSSKGVLSALSEADTLSSREKDNIPTHSSKTANTFHTEPITLVGFDDIVLEISANDLLTPLKREGTAFSIDKIAHDYFSTYLSVPYTGDVASDCKIVFAPPVALGLGTVTTTPLTRPIVNVSPVTFTANYMGKNYPFTLNGEDYNCTVGLKYD